MHAGASSYWKALATTTAVLAGANAVVTNVFVAVMTPEDWASRALPALAWAAVLTILTALFVLMGTVASRRRSSKSPQMWLLAFGVPAVAWTIIGLVVGDWLLPVYTLYGLSAGVVSGAVLTVSLAMLRRSSDRAPSHRSPSPPAPSAQA